MKKERTRPMIINEVTTQGNTKIPALEKQKGNIQVLFNAELTNYLRTYLPYVAYGSALLFRAYGVVVNMFHFHRSDWGSNPGRDGKMS